MDVAPVRKADVLRQRIEEMCQTRIKDSRGRIVTIGEIASKEAGSLEVKNSVVALISTVLAMRQKWEQTAQPRLEAFKTNYSQIKTLHDLKTLMESMDEREFCAEVLGIQVKKTPFWRYVMLKELINALTYHGKVRGFRDDWDAIQDWARAVDINDLQSDVVGKIKDVGLATVQNLRLTCGVDTVKPDVHVKKALKEIGLGNEVQVVELLSELTGYSRRELDQIFWYWDKSRSTKEEISLDKFEKL